MSLTNDDKKWISKSIGGIIKFEIRSLEEKLNNKFEGIPNVDQFNDLKDTMLGTLNKHEDELLIVSSRVSRLEEEVSKIKKKLK